MVTDVQERLRPPCSSIQPTSGLLSLGVSAGASGRVKVGFRVPTFGLRSLGVSAGASGAGIGFKGLKGRA